MVILLTDCHNKVIDRFSQIAGYRRLLWANRINCAAGVSGIPSRRRADKIFCKDAMFLLFCLLSRRKSQIQPRFNGVIPFLTVTPVWRQRCFAILFFAETLKRSDVEFIIHNPCVCSSCIPYLKNGVCFEPPLSKKWNTIGGDFGPRGGQKSPPIGSYVIYKLRSCVPLVPNFSCSFYFTR